MSCEVLIKSLVLELGYVLSPSVVFCADRLLPQVASGRSQWSAQIRSAEFGAISWDACNIRQNWTNEKRCSLAHSHGWKLSLPHPRKGDTLRRNLEHAQKQHRTQWCRYRHQSQECPHEWHSSQKASFRPPQNLLSRIHLLDEQKKCAKCTPPIARLPLRTPGWPATCLR